VVLSLDLIITLMAIAPFLAAMLAPLLFRVLGSWSAWLVALVPAGIFLWFWSLLPATAPIAVGFDWVSAYSIRFSFLIDGLSLIFVLTITGIGTLILVYSGAYLKGHPQQGRFLGLLLAFMGAMLGLVLADSLVTLVAFWELTTVTSFLLIGFDHERQKARRAAMQALVMTTLGGLTLLLAAVLLYVNFGSWDISALNTMGGQLRESPLYPLVLLLVLGAAFTKSAQVPFHFWLPSAMEAPTPVSAFLHSATMVQAGVYLTLRLTPLLGGTPLWCDLLTLFGGATLIWGSVMALRQTDLKQMLAQTTIASLGLLILLIGFSGRLAVAAALVYFIAHALYKAALFLVVGVIDHETGTRELTALGGLREKLPATFIAAAIGGFSMLGLPLSIGYLAKEEIYASLATADWRTLLALVALVAGNALLGTVGLVLALKPFLGAEIATPKAPHEASPSLVAGPLALALLGLVTGIATGWVGTIVLAPAVGAALGAPVTSHLSLAIDPLSLLFRLSVLTWALAGLAFIRLDWLRTRLRRLDDLIPSTDNGFDHAMFGLIRFAGVLTRRLYHGRLELYLVTLFVLTAVAILGPMLVLGGLPTLPAWPHLTFYEWGVLLVALAGLGALLFAGSRLNAIVSLGIQGFAVAMIFLLFGAPDLAFTQFMVEILSVVILALVMTRLKLDTRDSMALPALLRDTVIAVLCGGGIALLLLVTVSGPLDLRLTDFFTATSVAVAHGHNIVNVILVDYRGLDTLGEISVVMTAGIAILALIRSQRRPAPPEPRLEKAAGAPP
jgi:multicomponent Na+:H+ antiporter subunit A